MQNFLFLISFHLILLFNLNVNCCFTNDVDEPSCEIVDILKLFDEEAEPSYECITQYSNSIKLKPEGQITLECSAPYPIDLEYESVLPATHFDLSFYKRIHTGDPNFHREYNLDNLNTTFYITALLHGPDTPWAANYIIYDLTDKSRQTTISVFIEKNFPLFVSDKKDANAVVMASYDSNKENVLFPCRVQNWNSTVQLFSPDFEELTDGSFDDIVKFDPRTGFTVKWDPDRIVTGQYRCMTQLLEGDELKVEVVAPEDYKEHEPEPFINTPGTISFIKQDDYYSAQCKSSKKISPKIFGLVNVRSKNPTTTRYTYGCLDPEIICENRRTGAQTDSGYYEINPIYRSGMIRCTDKESLDYFLGSDSNIYFDSAEARSKNALVVVQPSQDYAYYLPTESYEMTCKLAEYICVKPIWWSLHYSNETELQSFESVKTTLTILMSNDVIGISCGVSLWNSSQWYTSYMPIQVAETSPPSIDTNVTEIEFELGSKNHVLQCKATGIPKPKLKWFRNGKEVDSSLTIQSEGGLDDLVLLFPHITLADTGNYTCKASNLLGSVEKNFSVQVVEIEYVLNIQAPPEKISWKECDAGINKTTTISTTKTITFFQFQPKRSDGQITIPNKDKIRPGDILYLHLPNVNSNRPELMEHGMNLTVRVLGLQGAGDETRGNSFKDNEPSRFDTLGKFALMFTITITCLALLLIICCGVGYYCYNTIR